MRKIDGLRFLQEHFPRLTVDCIFVDKVENLDEEALYKKDQVDQIWRVRGASKIGSELNMPMGSFKDVKLLKQFMKEQKKRNSNMEFVIHSVSPEYFAAPFVGTLAVYNDFKNPGIRIELQKVTKELVESIDKGNRPRDWEVSLILDYDFRYKFPRIRKNDNIDLEKVKYPIAVIHEIGEEIFNFYDKKGQVIDTYTRFNIYDLGQVLLDDHRSSESFVPRCEFKMPDRGLEKQKKVSQVSREER